MRRRRFHLRVFIRGWGEGGSRTCRRLLYLGSHMRRSKITIHIHTRTYEYIQHVLVNTMCSYIIALIAACVFAQAIQFGDGGRASEAHRRPALRGGRSARGHEHDAGRTRRLHTALLSRSRRHLPRYVSRVTHARLFRHSRSRAARTVETRTRSRGPNATIVPSP